LDDVIESIPATVANWRSSGVATADGMVSGLAPGKEALTCRVGKSTLGRSLTGNARYPAIPNSTMAIMTNAVITGRLMKISVMFMIQRFRWVLHYKRSGCLRETAKWEGQRSNTCKVKELET